MTPAETLLSAAAILVKQAQAMQGQVPDPKLAEIIATWQKMVEQFENESKPHAWRDWTSGMNPSDVGDGDAPDDDFLRAYGPFLAACTRNKWEDSTGGIFFVPNIKKRGGLGKDGWDLVKWETRRLWNDPRGQAWRADPANLAAGFVPDQAP